MNQFMGGLFALASLAMFAMVVLYLAVLGPGAPTGGWEDRIAYLESNWALYSAHWKIEFLAVAAIAFVSLHFGRRNSMWLLVAVGHLFYLTEYPLMVAGYLQADSESTFVLLNEMATFIFAAANMLWLAGMAGVYAHERGWFLAVGAGLAALAALASLAMFLGLIGLDKAAIAGVPILVLYLLNAWYGLTVLLRQDPATAG